MMKFNAYALEVKSRKF